MVRFSVFCTLVLLAIPLFSAQEERAVITPQLESLMKAKGSEELFRVIVILDEQIDHVSLDRSVSGMSPNERRMVVISELKGFTERSQKEVLLLLEGKEKSGDVINLRSLWINNTISGKMKEDVIRSVARMDGIRMIDHDPLIKMIESSGPDDPPPVIASVEWNIARVNASCAWAQGYKGQGIIVGNIDTGVNYNHTDLASHFWRNDAEFFGSPGFDDDGNGYVDDIRGYNFAYNNGDPMDDQSHGTHTAGTVAGDGTGGDTVGVAPEAMIMAIKSLDSLGSGSWSNIFLGAQYGLDNGAHVLTLSIGNPFQPDFCDPAARNTFNNILLAGVVSTIAAGNNGGPGPTINTPGTVPPPWHHPDQGVSGGLSGAITVGATTSGGSDPIWSGSSLGPTTCWGDYPNPYLIDPDVVAPGACVTSLHYLGGYWACWNGTSMATPHVAGAIAIMLSKNSALTPAELDSIIEMTAVERGAAGKDNIYGAGRLDVCAAISAVGVEESTEPGTQNMKFALLQNLPNPFQSITTISYSIPIKGEVSLRIYDIMGRLVETLVSEEKEPGVYQVEWDGKEHTSGVYFYRLRSGKSVATRKLTLLQ
jgi:serine protease AprX